MIWLASYARKSRALGDPDTVDVVAHQLAHSDRMALGMGYLIPPENRLAEIGSGERLTQRPRMAALLAGLESDPPPAGGILWVPEVARLTRADPEEFGKIMRILRTADVKVCVAGRLLDLRQPDDEMWFTWMAAGSRHEVQRYKVRVSMKVDQLLAEGAVRNGGAPFGYRWIPGDYLPQDRRRLPGRLEADPAHFPVLVACCQRVLLVSVHALSREYQVSMLRLYNALKNPTICGYPSIHTRGNKKLPRERWTWAGQENTTYPHACTRAEWEAIQAALWRRARRRERTQTPDAWCRDVVRFMDQEGEGYLSSIRWGPPERRVSRLIYALRENSAATRWSAYIERDRVHRAVEERLLSLFADPGEVGRLVTAYQERRAGEPGTSAEPEIQAELKRLTRHYQEAVEREFDAQEPLRSALSKRRIRLEQEIRAAELRLAEEREVKGRAATVDALLAELPRLAERFAERWPACGEAERRGLVRAVVAEVRVRSVRVGKLLRVRAVEEVVLQPWFQDSPCVTRCTERTTHGEFRQHLFTVKRAKL